MNLLNNKPGESIPLGFVVATTLTLFGCGGEGNEGSAGSTVSVSSNTQSATLSAQNATYSTGYAESFEVDLSSKVFSSTGGGFALSEVEVLSNDDSCQVESMTETGFVIQASDTKVCDYRYHVTPRTLSPMSRMAEWPMAMKDNSSAEDSSSAVARIAVSSDPGSTELVPVSATTLINEDVSISLKSELDKVGFTLGDEFVLTELTLPYARSSSAQINDTDDQVLEYTPPQGFTGIDRVLYTLEDSANGLVLMGVLDIAVGYEANQGFSIPYYNNHDEILDINTEYAIDLSRYVVSDDNDDYQLVYVSTFDGSVRVSDPLDVLNKEIIFSAEAPGEYDISFAVSDHNGVYDTGSLRVKVIDFSSIQVWDEIISDGYRYISPMTTADAVLYGAEYSESLSRVHGYYEMVHGSSEQLINTCQSIGAIAPTSDMFGSTEFIQEAKKASWPKGDLYQMRSGAFDLSSESAVVDEGNGYFTCAYAVGITATPSKGMAVANYSDEVSVEVTLTEDDGSPRVGAFVSADLSSGNAHLSPSYAYSDAQGKAVFALTSAIAGPYSLYFDYQENIATVNVEFEADRNTASLSIKSEEDVTYNISDVIPITATLKDYYNNKISEADINWTANYDVIPLPTITKTDVEGKTGASLSFPSALLPTLLEPLTVDVQYVQPNGRIIEGREFIKIESKIGSGFKIGSGGYECLSDGYSQLDYNGKCLRYSLNSENFGFNNNTFIIFEGDPSRVADSLVVDGYYRQKFPGALGIWRLLGCFDTTCVTNEVVKSDFPLNFDTVESPGVQTINASKSYPAYKLQFVSGPVDPNGGSGSGHFSEITLNYK